MEISNKVAIITGGTGGIGVAIVKCLLKHKIKFVAIFDLDNSNTRMEFSRLEKKYGNRVGFYTCDVTNRAQYAENFDQVLKVYKTVDILLNNAGIASDVNTELMMDINYKAVVLGSLLFIERLGKQNGGNGGVIVNTSSILGLLNHSDMPIYCSTKHATVSFTRCLDEQFNFTGVRVVAICPGLTDTPLLSDASNTLTFIGKVVNSRTNYQETQPPEDVGEAVVEIIQKGKSGDVWVSEPNESIYAVRDIDYKKLRIPIEE